MFSSDELPVVDSNIPLSTAERLRQAFAYGFPLDEETLERACNLAFPVVIPENADYFQRQSIESRQTAALLNHLERAGTTVWPQEQGLAKVRNGAKSGLIHYLVVSVHQNDDILPDAEIMMKLKEIMRKVGIMTEPGWYRVVRDRRWNRSSCGWYLVELFVSLTGRCTVILLSYYPNYAIPC